MELLAIVLDWKNAEKNELVFEIVELALYCLLMVGERKKEKFSPRGRGFEIFYQKESSQTLE